MEQPAYTNAKRSNKGTYLLILFVLVIGAVSLVILDLKVSNGLSLQFQQARVSDLEMKEVSYYSPTLRQNLTLDIPRYVVFPDYLKIYDYLANGVVIKKSDSSHFTLETDGTAVPVVLASQTAFTQLTNPSSYPADYRNASYGTTTLSGYHPELINNSDYLTVFFNKTSSASGGLANWEKDINGYYIAQKLLLYK